MIISVPHSGTRSLREHLGADSYWHWGLNDTDINAFTGHADIPIRNPVDIARSWDARYPTEEHKGADDMLQCMDSMMAFITGHPNHKLWRCEDLPANIGRGPDKTNEPTARTVALKLWLSGANMTFYEQHYPDLQRQI